MAWVYTGSLGLPAAAVLFADAMSRAADAADSLDQWKAISELGIATVIAAVSFFSLVWWFRSNYVRTSKRLDALELFQQTELLKATNTSSEALVKAADTMKSVSDNMSAMTEALVGMQGRLEFRPCFALDAMDDEARQKIIVQIRKAIAAAHAKELVHGQ